MFKNLNQLKNKVEVGQKVSVINHLKNINEDRVIIQKQTNGVYTGIEISKEEYQEKRRNWLTKNSVIEIEDNYFTKSFLEYQKAKQMKFNGNTVEFLAFDKEQYGSLVRSPSLDFEVNESWLTLVFS